jgi:DNA repair protein RadC
MQINQATLHHQVVRFDASDRLATTRQLLTYLTAAIPDTGEESFWIACLNPNRRPICRTRIKTGVLVAARVSVRDVFLAVLLAEAKAFACLRLQPDGAAQPSLADGRLNWNLQETARLMNIEFIDYLIAPTGGRGYHSWRESERHGG